MNIEVGKEYVCKHERKGTFRMRVKQVDDVWVTGEVTAGQASAFLDYNTRYAGEDVTVRRTHCKFDDQVECKCGKRECSQCGEDPAAYAGAPTRLVEFDETEASAEAAQAARERQSHS